MEREDWEAFKAGAHQMYKAGGIKNVLNCLEVMSQTQMIIINEIKEILKNESNEKN